MSGIACIVAPLTMMSTPYCFVSPSSREPRFTVSPSTVYAMRNCEPMLPTFIEPVLTPTPMRTGGQPRAANSSRIRAVHAIISSAASTAWRACSASCNGAPQNAMIASPMYLSMVPRWR